MEIFDNVSITLAWDYPGGDVLVFIIVYIERVEPMREFNVSVNGTETNFTLIDLEPSTTYGVTIITENDFGMSAASPVLITETARMYTNSNEGGRGEGIRCPVLPWEILGLYKHLQHLELLTT